MWNTSTCGQRLMYFWLPCFYLHSQITTKHLLLLVKKNLFKNVDASTFHQRCKRSQQRWSFLLIFTTSTSLTIFIFCFSNFSRSVTQESQVPLSKSTKIEYSLAGNFTLCSLLMDKLGKLTWVSNRSLKSTAFFTVNSLLNFVLVSSQNFLFLFLHIFTHFFIKLKNATFGFLEIFLDDPDNYRPKKNELKTWKIIDKNVLDYYSCWHSFSF